MDHRRHILCNLESALLRQQVPDQQEPILNKESFVQLFSNVVSYFVNLPYSRTFPFIFTFNYITNIVQEVLDLCFQLLDFKSEGKLIQVDIIDLFKEKLW